MSSLFLCGSLQDPPVLQAVLGAGRPVRTVPASLPDHRLNQMRGGDLVWAVAGRSAPLEGVLLPDPGAGDEARLMYFAALTGLSPRRVTVQTAAGPRPCRALVGEPGRGQPVADWSVTEWAATFRELLLLVVDELLACFGREVAEDLAPFLPQVRARAASRLRAAANPAPATVRSRRTGDDVIIGETRRPYERFFQIEEQDVRFRKYDGSMSSQVVRAAFVGGDAVTVLPYDPVRDRVLVVEQFRFAPHVRGDPNPWCLEPIAGRMDAGEGPEDTAMREALEETGVAISRPELVARYYVSPGAVTEYLYSYVALADLPDTAAGIGGEEAENEDIRGILLGFDALMALVRSGEAETGPLIVSAMWLAANRDRLRRDA